MKSMALVPLAALSFLIIASSQDWVRPRLDAQLGWDPGRGLDFELNVAVESAFGGGFLARFRRG